MNANECGIKTAVINLTVAGGMQEKEPKNKRNANFLILFRFIIFLHHPAGKSTLNTPLSMLWGYSSVYLL